MIINKRDKFGDTDQSYSPKFASTPQTPMIWGKGQKQIRYNSAMGDPRGENSRKNLSEIWSSSDSHKTGEFTTVDI